MLFERSIEIQAPRERVWAALADIERWPEWTASMKSVELIDGRPIGVGSKLRVKQPRLSPLLWEITEWAPLDGFTWRSSVAGMTNIGTHYIVSSADAGLVVRLALQQTGVFAPIIGLVTSGITRRYIDMEARGLKSRSEQLPADR